jgi:hypothetical protein
MTTPVNQKFRRMIESEDMRNMNTNLNTQQSFSSFLTNLTNLNYATSNGSSFHINNNEEKKIKMHNVGVNNNNNTHITNTNKNTNCVNLTPLITTTENCSNSNISNSNNHNVNDLHAKSVDLTNQSPLKLNNYNSSSYVYPNNQFINADYDFSHSMHGNINMNRNYITPRNFMSTNPMAPYSFCSDNNVYYKGYLENMNNNSANKSNISNICPIKFNPNDDKSVIDNVMILIKDQNGCRMIQKKLEEKKDDFLLKFFEKV